MHRGEILRILLKLKNAKKSTLQADLGFKNGSKKVTSDDAKYFIKHRHLLLS